MCVAIPSKVVALADDGRIAVESFGVRRMVSALLLDEPVAIGDYVLVRAGGYAFERLDEAQALESLALLAEVDASLAMAGD